MFSDAGSARQIEHKTNQTPLKSTKQNGDEREDVARCGVNERNVGKENREVDKGHREPAHISLHVPS